MGNGLVINTNVAAINTGRTLRRSTGSLNRTLERLSSGLRINRARDDAAGLAIAETLRTKVRGFGVAQRNSQDGISLVQTAEGAIGEVASILQRMRELAVQAANGTNSATNRSDLQLEVTQLHDQINDIANNTEFNGISILNGTTPSITLQVGPDSGETLVISLANNTATGLGLPTPPDIATSTATASAAIGSIDGILTTLNTRRATLGAAQNRLEFTVNVLAIQEENSAAAESSIRDADIARETVNFTRTQILVSAGTSILAQANLVPQTALQLLG